MPRRMVLVELHDDGEVTYRAQHRAGRESRWREIRTKRRTLSVDSSPGNGPELEVPAPDPEALRSLARMLLGDG